MRPMIFVFASLALGASCLALTGAALAQASVQVPPAQAPAAETRAETPAPAGTNGTDLGNEVGGLNIPDNVKLFGSSEPNVYRPTARVNGEVITQTDVDQRVALFVLANNIQPSAKETEALRTEVFGALVDEKLKTQEALANDITVSDEEVLERFNAIAQQFGQTPKTFAKFLADNGSSSVSLGTQIRSELAWNRVLGRKVEPFTNVSEEEVKALIDRLKADKGKAEYRLAEIYLSSTPETAAATQENVKRLIDQIRQGANFPDLARRFSEATTAVVGGDLGFVQLDQLPPSLAEAAAQMQPGQLVGPITVPGGYSILYLVDVKRILTADARDAVLSLKQVTLPFSSGVSAEQVNTAASNFAERAQALQGCGSVDAFAQGVGATVVSRDQVSMRDLPGALQETLATLPIGRTTQPFGSQDQGISVLVLCGREMPEDVAAPDPDRVEKQLLDDKIEKRAKRYLRDLRLDALIQYS